LRTGNALDAFARNGQLTLACYHDKIGRVTAWELSAEHRPSLERFQLYDMEFGDSYQLALDHEIEKFDFIVIDTPQGAHKDSKGFVHFEHFDFFRAALAHLAAKRCIVVLYVNKSPYDKDEVGSHGYDEYEEYDFPSWLRARSDFYNVGCETDVSESQALSAYARLARGAGYKVKNTLMVPCFSDVAGREPYAFRVAIEVEREDD
jgi:hypothetical protein